MATIHELVSLEGKVALVTGGAMGIGKGIAARLAEAGAKVMIGDVNLEAAQATVAEFAALGYTAAAVKSDVSDAADVDRTVQAVVDAWGQIDILVNNAGVYPMTAVMDLTEAIWDRTIDINLKGSFLMAQAAARRMIAAGRGGRIVNIASVDGFRPTGNLVHYDASKGGVVMMTRALAKDLAPFKIRVNAVAPGSIATPGTATASAQLASLTPEQMEQMMAAFMSKVPLGRMGEPDDIARTVLFLACDLSDYVDGEIVATDGGYLSA
jgi:2-deoxy-D-gluconate 3-dehydrogenase